MKKAEYYLKKYKKLHICCTAEIIIAAVLMIIGRYRNISNCITQNITTPFKRFLGSINSIFPFSVMEVMLIVFVMGIFIYLIFWVKKLIKGEKKQAIAYIGALGLICVLLAVYDAMYFLWGINFNTDGFCDRAGLYDEKVSNEQLYEAALFFSENLNEAALKVPRDENKYLDYSVEAAFSESISIYDNIEKKYTFLAFEDKMPKKMMFSHLMSVMNYTGIFFPLSGESNINTEPPICLIPATISHEFAHRRGIVSEAECNYLGVAASIMSDNDIYKYSGWLLGYIYIENALYKADKALWQDVNGRLNEGVRADLKSNSDFWKKYENSAISQGADIAYDNFLKSYGDSNGIKSYGLVTDLLVCNYKELE